MTQSQKDAIAKAQANYIAAQDTVDEEAPKMATAQAAMEAAQTDYDRDLPVRIDQMRQAGRDNIAMATKVRDAQFQITNDAYRALDQAQLDLENAIRNSRQTGAIEQTGAAA